MRIITLLICALILQIFVSCVNANVQDQTTNSMRAAHEETKPQRSNEKDPQIANEDDRQIVVEKDAQIEAANEPKDTLAILLDIVEKKFPDANLYAKQYGDINKDQLIDAILVMEKKCGDDDASASDESRCRKALLLLNKGFPNFEIVFVNDYLVECSDCGGAGVGDPYQGIAIKNGYFSFEALYGSCYKTFQVITFKYDAAEKDWFLHKIGTEDYNCKETESSEVEVYTKTKTVDDFGKIRFNDYVNK